MNSDERACPYCGEPIKMVAIKCKHCMSSLIPDIPKVPVNYIEVEDDVFKNNNKNLFEKIKSYIFNNIESDDKFRSTKKIRNICIALTAIQCLFAYNFYTSLGSKIGTVATTNSQDTIQKFSIGLFIFSCISFIGLNVFFGQLHGLGFRWFTKFNKKTMPDLIWRYFIQVCVQFGLAIFYIVFGLLFTIININYFDLSVIVFLFLLSFVVIYFLSLTLLTKNLFEIKTREAWKTSIVPTLFIAIVLSPLLVFSTNQMFQINKISNNFGNESKQDQHQEIIAQNNNMHRQQNFLTENNIKNYSQSDNEKINTQKNTNNYLFDEDVHPKKIDGLNVVHSWNFTNHNINILLKNYQDDPYYDDVPKINCDKQNKSLPKICGYTQAWNLANVLRRLKIEGYEISNNTTSNHLTKYPYRNELLQCQDEKCIKTELEKMWYSTDVDVNLTSHGMKN